MKVPCWRCVANLMLASPPLMAYVLYQRYRKQAGFQAALSGLQVRLERLRDLEAGAQEFEEAVKASEEVSRP